MEYILTIFFIATILPFTIYLIKEDKKATKDYEEELLKEQKETESKKKENNNTESDEEPKELKTADCSTFIFCTKCYSKNKPQNQYCFNCGNSLTLSFQVKEEDTTNDQLIYQLKKENKSLRKKLNDKNDEIRILESKLNIASTLNANNNTSTNDDSKYKIIQLEGQLNQAQIDILNLQNRYNNSQEENRNLKNTIEKLKNTPQDETVSKTEIELKNRIMQLEAQLKLAQSSSMNDEAVEQLRAENRELHQKIDEYTANDDYRKRYPAQYLCESGHWVRSKSEREICNFLFQHRIRYVFEKEYVYNPKSYPYYPDFYLPDYNLFIEYFGIHEDPQYNEKTKRKLDIYSNDTTHQFEFITFADDNRLQERLREICQKYNMPLS